MLGALGGWESLSWDLQGLLEVAVSSLQIGLHSWASSNQLLPVVCGPCGLQDDLCPCPSAAVFLVFAPT